MTTVDYPLFWQIGSRARAIFLMRLSSRHCCAIQSVVWNRLIFPNGRSMVLERQPGADAEGYAGLEDGVDYHWGDLFKAAALSTLLSVGAEAGSSGQESDIIRAPRNGASDSINQTGQ